jgi:GH15 family glucan-1,4-alpha-glucosidase
MAMNMHGLSERSMRFYRFLYGVRRPKGEILQRYAGGYPAVSRDGEADITPIVIQGIYDTYRTTKDVDFLEEMWELVNDGAGYIAENVDEELGLVHTTCSIHEERGLEEGFEIWANSASVKGLLDASKIAQALGDRRSAETWLCQARAIRRKIFENLYDAESGVFIKNLRMNGTRVDAPDVAQLSPFYFGICADMRIMVSTLAHLRQTLWNIKVGGFNRFRDFEIVTDWHWYTGGKDASWPLFTLWGAKFYHRAGDAGMASECMDFVRRASSREMEIPEKVAPMSGYVEWKNHEMEYNERLLHGIARADSSTVAIPDYVSWACPLGWSHAEYLMMMREDNSAESCAMLDQVGPSA